MKHPKTFPATYENYGCIQTRPSLGTMEAIEECQRLLQALDPNILVRPPKYLVAHRAIIEMRDRLRAQAQEQCP